MNNLFVAWLIDNWIEITGSILGILYVFLSIKQNILTWLMGLLASLLYIYVFFVSKFYADMSLQVYYVWISIYGWLLWSKGKQTNEGRKVLAVSRLSKQMLFRLAAVSMVLWVLIFFILKHLTDSPVPVGDSFTTAFSIVATYMLARKILEHWLVWIVVDAVSLLLYIWKGLYPTSVMFGVYTIAAVWGFIEWKKTINNTPANA
jgi:nicotinamide mononucleotide transporter